MSFAGHAPHRRTRSPAGIVSLCLGVALALCAHLPSALAADVANDIPPRLQWAENFGYCGEVSFISAGLYYGQYVSQYDARRIASRGADQSKERSQLLLGMNDLHAASKMHLSVEAWDSDSAQNSSNFLAWVKENVASGFPVIIGIYVNQSISTGSDDEDAGDPQYDHIVPVFGISSKHPLTAPWIYYSDDVIKFSDNGDSGAPTFLYNYAFGPFQASRQEANSESRPLYSLPRRGGNYGVAVTGIIDHDGETLPVRVTTDVNTEEPPMRRGSNTRPAAQNLTLTVTVSGLRPGVTYNLYRYNNFESVPNSGFNRKASNAARVWKVNIASGSTYSIMEGILSNQTAVYRAVPDSAP